MIDSREKSRHQGRPVRLFLFKGVEPTLEVLTRSVTIIPGTTEFGYGTTPVTGTDTGKQLNRISTQPLTDFVHSIEELLVGARLVPSGPNRVALSAVLQNGHVDGPDVGGFPIVAITGGEWAMDFVGA